MKTHRPQTAGHRRRNCFAKRSHHPSTYAPANSEPAVVREESAEYELVSPPSTPKPLKDNDGEIFRVRVYDEKE